MLVVLGDGVPAFLCNAQITVGVGIAGQDTGDDIADRAAAQTGQVLVLLIELRLGPQVGPIGGSLILGELVLIVDQQNSLLDDCMVVALVIVQTGGNLVCPLRHEGDQDVLGLQGLPDDRVQTEHNVSNGRSLLSQQTVLGISSTCADHLNLEAVLCGTLDQPLIAAIGIGVGVDVQGNAGALVGGGVVSSGGSSSAGSSGGAGRRTTTSGQCSSGCGKGCSLDEAATRNLSHDFSPFSFSSVNFAGSGLFPLVLCSVYRQNWNESIKYR